jgi:hypothetical protein
MHAPGTQVDFNQGLDMRNAIDASSSLSADQLATLEADLQLKLPDDYRSFLMDTNGVRPGAAAVDVAGLPERTTDVQTFFGINRPVLTSNIVWNVRLLAQQPSQAPVVPIACDSGGGLFCLRAKSPGFEVVFLEVGRAPSEAHLVAPSFGGFLRQLQPQA